MSQDAATITLFSNVHNPPFRSNFPPNYSILISIFYHIITIPTLYIFMSMIMIWRHVHILLISQYSLVRVNIYSKRLESLDHRVPWLNDYQDIPYNIGKWQTLDIVQGGYNKDWISTTWYTLARRR